MANNYRNAKIKLTDPTRSLFYTGKSQTTAIIRSIRGCNSSALVNSNVTLSLDTAAGGSYDVFINRALYTGQDLELLAFTPGDLISTAQPPPLVVQEGELLYIKLDGDNADGVDIISSILEIN